MPARLAITLVIVLLPAAFAEGRGPNVVIFYADDMGIGDLGCYGCEDIRTPNIDGLAERGIRFTNYYSAAPICSPSRAALMTGRYPQRAGVPTNVSSLMGQRGMPPEQITIAELARSAGYATALIGKWHLGSDFETQANSQGFDFFYGYHACIDYWSHMFYYDNVPHYHDWYRNRIEIHEEGQHVTSLITREALRWLDDHHAEPFFLYVPFHAPHYPMQPLPHFIEEYAHLPHERAVYAGLVAGMDEAVGKIMARLREYNLVDDTMVYFMSDNGISGETRANGKGGNSGPYRGHKFSLFEGGIHMPAIVSWPGRLKRGVVRDQVVFAGDVWPTVAEVIGARVPAGHKVDGKSWMRILEDEGAPGHETLFFEWNEQHAVRQGRWKVIRNVIVTHGMSKQTRFKPDEEDYIHLVDLEADPGETTNLRRRHPEIAERLLRLHDAWREDVFESGFD